MTDFVAAILKAFFVGEGRGGPVSAEIFRAVARLRSEGQAVALATVIETRGSAPRGPGAKMFVTADGHTVGTAGGGWPESEVRCAAMEAIRSGAPRIRRVEMTADLAAGEGAICGGIMEVFIEPLGPGLTSTDVSINPPGRRDPGDSAGEPMPPTARSCEPGRIE